MYQARRTKVLLVITKSNWGGAQRYVYDLAVRLDPVRYEVAVAAGATGELMARLKEQKIATFSVGALTRNVDWHSEIRAIKQLAAVIRQFGPDVLHVNSSKAGLYGVLIGRLSNVPAVVFTAHGWAFNEARPLWQRAFLKTLHWLTVIQSHCTLVVSSALIRQLSWPGTKKKMHLVRLGLGRVQFRSREDARRQLIEKLGKERKCGLVGSELWIGTIAELAPIKNLPIAIAGIAAVAHEFPTLRYLVIGEGEERSCLQQQINHLGLNDQVFLVGAIWEAAQYLKAFDVFLLPSKSEAAGYVILEAGVAEVPVIATSVGGVPELVTHRETGYLLRPNSVDEIVSAIRAYMQQPQAFHCYAQAFFSICAQSTLDRMADETIRHYEELLAR